MASRIIAYIVLTATQVFGRAFAQAYREAAAKAGKGGNAARAANAANNARKQAATAATAASISRRSGMSLDEAMKVLNITAETPKEEVKAAYEHMFEANSKKKGGSFYLQSKVYRARQTLEDLQPEKFGDAKQTASSSSSSTADANTAPSSSSSSSSSSSESQSTKSDSSSK
ncbi:hypothetical protein PTSG_06640 [Salpingoeca rosetta]|uniref:Mitochondrial import inner membrane translocase subunit tim16 n=1 Tax=Salpingoeca rosetta (strain ATCC 50818 / BSB-021) TaxID=946362 RepID=F2UFK3_SALR5|nr:uncharacterized protein PTSG_06640 [Salpingoeca rosetta]EGD75571.1 hypothetical protein PTSG_06640 [Salpingoeca rosetta]|eukprot:XP_004992028.1 hypothetical protein PTSG_06640 [Salpingoeca rosetta]